MYGVSDINFLWIETNSTKSFQIELRLANQIGALFSYDSAFHTLILSKNLKVFNIFVSQKLFVMN